MINYLIFALSLVGLAFSGNFLVSSAKKLKEETGFEPLFTSLESIINTAWNWHQKRFGQTH